MERFKNKMRDKEERYLLELENVADILDVHVDAVRTLVDMGLLPCINSSPRFEPRFRAEDVRFLLVK